MRPPLPAVDWARLTSSPVAEIVTDGPARFRVGDRLAEVEAAVRSHVNRPVARVEGGRSKVTAAAPVVYGVRE